MSTKKQPRYIQKLDEREAEAWRQIAALMEVIGKKTRHARALFNTKTTPIVDNDTPIEEWVAIVARLRVINTVRSIRWDLERSARMAKKGRAR